MKYMKLFITLMLLLSVGCTSMNPSSNPAESNQTNVGGVEQATTMQLIHEADQIIQKDALVYSFLFIEDGVVLFEKYYNESRRTQANNIKSVTKVVMSSLIGIAISEGRITSVDQKIADFFPGYSFTGGKENITVKHLLTMTDGLDIEENSPVMMEIFSSKNWIDRILKLPLANPPGEKYNYSTASTHLLSAIITRATGMDALQYANKKLFNPLGFTARKWSADPQGNNLGGADLYLTPLQMSKIGQLYLDQGKWSGKQIISEDWIKASTSVQSDGGGEPNTASYGYGWWLLNSMDKYKGRDLFVATGYGTQYMVIDPHRRTIIITTRKSDIYPDKVISHFDTILTTIPWQ